MDQFSVLPEFFNNFLLFPILSHSKFSSEFAYAYDSINNGHACESNGNISKFISQPTLTVNRSDSIISPFGDNLFKCQQGSTIKC